MSFSKCFAVLVALTIQGPSFSAAFDEPRSMLRRGLKQEKVVICHIPPGNPDNEITIEVSASALDSHLAHGDYLGPCGTNSPDENEEEDSPGVVTLSGLSPNGFNPSDANFQFSVTGAVFETSSDNTRVSVNGSILPEANVAVTADAVSVSSLLPFGLNMISLFALDSEGLLLSYQASVWVGGGALEVLVLNEVGVVVPDAVVTVTLSDDIQVTQSKTTGANGVSTFNNVPLRTLIISVVGDGTFGTVSSVGGGSVVLTLLGFNPPSTIDNNDFSLGTEGWDISNANFVAITPHQEGFPSGRRLVSDDKPDLTVGTGGVQGESSTSRTFTIAPDTKSVCLRYRFITSEVPGGYYGSIFNDYFAVSIRSQNAGKQVSEANAMNGFPLAAFDFASGATEWREIDLPVDTQGDVVQVDVTVANVGDNAFDSFVVVDKVEEKKVSITAMELFDIDNSPLAYLSASAHTYFGGNTRIHGTITIKGPEDESLKSVILEIVQGGSVKATATLASGASPALIREFGPTEQVFIDTAQLMFELPSAQAALIDGSTDGIVTLRAKATTISGIEATREFDTAPQILIRHIGNPRYGDGRDEDVGGDDWVKPSVNTVVLYFGFRVGDLSNMNGGIFKPHKTHQTGNDVDAWFDGYNARDAGTAATILGYLNDVTYGSRISTVYVTYAIESTNAFWNAIKDVTLADGRLAPNVILPVGGHTTHFHLLISSA